MNTFKDILKHPFVITAIGFFIAVIGLFSIMLSFSKEKHTIITSGPTHVISHDATSSTITISEAAGTSDTGSENGRGVTAQDVYEVPISRGNIISINNFGEKASIRSPLILTGMVPNYWVFEGVFPIDLYSLEGELITQSYGSANIFDKNGAIIEGHVPFRALLKFGVPEGVYEGKIRFAADNPSGEVQNEDVVEVMVLFE